MYLRSVEQPHYLGYALSAVLVLYVIAYIIYQRFLHPLAKYPGPFWASVTDIWQALEFLSLRQPYRLTELHEKYGPVVRYGPDKVSITYESAVQAIYQKSSKALPKTEFYDAFGGAHPNVFGTRDESVCYLYLSFFSTNVSDGCQSTIQFDGVICLTPFQ
jgi:hypothetical protein